MRYLNQPVLDAIDTAEFKSRHPFPWVNPQYFILPDAYESLLSSMPSLAQFQASFGETRKHGQTSHDRYILDYQDSMELAAPWRDFVQELRGPAYRAFVCRLLGIGGVRLRFHWHYTPNGAEVSPHCDAKDKIGTQIFYLNTREDWKPAWGGATILLDDAGRLNRDSAPAFEDFAAEYPAETEDNRSILFERQDHSWHGVRKINSPEGYYRKVFIVVFYEHRPVRAALKKARRVLTGKPALSDKDALKY